MTTHSTGNSPQSLRTAAPASTKLGAQDAANAASVAKRLSSELMSLMMAPPAGISAFPASDEDLTLWKGRIEGAERDGEWDYRARYTKVKHPNVDLHGNICLDILKEKWSPMLSVPTILVSLQSLLGEPNNASPLNIEASELWDDQVAFKKEVLKYYKEIVEDDE
ncbi:ubiquitin-conjugating enzyme E2 C [Pseudohyphozyma bogoriensis]|nr:ubiquitin-conjugating enzyme E2 C [Pseudohyphozyma bogoriensis]